MKIKTRRGEAETPVPPMRNAEKMLRCRVRMLRRVHSCIINAVILGRLEQSIILRFPVMKGSRGLLDGLLVRS